MPGSIFNIQNPLKLTLIFFAVETTYAHSYFHVLYIFRTIHIVIKADCSLREQ